MNPNEIQWRRRYAQGGKSQALRILEALREAFPAWVSEPELLERSGSPAVHARMGDLRRQLEPQGWTVVNATERGPDDRCRSRYRLARVAASAGGVA